MRLGSLSFQSRCRQRRLIRIFRLRIKFFQVFISYDLNAIIVHRPVFLQDFQSHFRLSFSQIKGYFEKIGRISELLQFFTSPDTADKCIIDINFVIAHFFRFPSLVLDSYPMLSTGCFRKFQSVRQATSLVNMTVITVIILFK